MHLSLLVFFCCLVVTHVSAAVWSGAGDPNHLLDSANWENGSAPTYEDPVWEIPTGYTVRLDTLDAPAWIIKRGEGVLELGSNLSTQISLEMEQGTVRWTDAVTLGHLRLSGGTVLAGQGLQVGLLEIAGNINFNLAAMPNLTMDTLRIESTGTVVWSEHVLVNYLEINGGVVDFTDTRVPASIAITLNGGEMLGGIIEANVTSLGGTMNSIMLGNFYLRGSVSSSSTSQIYGQTLLEGGTLTGYLSTIGSVFVPWYAGQTHIHGTLYLESMGYLVFLLEMPELIMPILVTGELSSYMTQVLDFGLVDWHDPYWDDIREITVIDAWQGGIVSATFAHDETVGDGQGLWSRVDNAEGDVIIRWDPSSATPVPEASTSGLLAIAALMLAIGRRKRRGMPQ